MFKKLITVCLLSTIASAASADSYSWYENSIGNSTYYSGDVNGYSNTIGNTTYYNINGATGSATRSGNTTFYNGALSGSSTNIGSSTYYYLWD